MKHANRGFTLVELLVVIGIIALLISILLPALTKARTAAVQVTCASNLRQLGMIWYNYSNANKGYFPDGLEYGGTWEILSAQKKQTFIDMTKMKQGKIFYCPTARGYSEAAKAGNVDADWDVQINTGIGLANHIGYAIYAHNGNAIAWDKYFSINGTSPTRPSYPPPTKTKAKRLAELPLIMDSVQRFLPPGDPFITWAYSNHFNQKNGLPLGGNTLYGDGHVEWKRFDLRSAIQIMWSSNADHERWW